MNFIVYQAYGNTEICYEAIYAILSYLRVSPEQPAANSCQIVVYTDREDLFRHYLNDSKTPIRYEQLAQELITEWRGSINFVHRVKIKVLQDFFSKELGNVLYTDTDTCFLADPTPIFNQIGRGELFMHTNEGSIQNPGHRIFTKLYKYLQSSRFGVLIEGKRQTVPQQIEMWNAGVLGINDRHKGLLQHVLAFTDALYPLLPLHIIEQFAFSVYFQQYRQIKAADEYIYHYWDFKEFRTVLTEFFTRYKGRSTKELIELSSKIWPAELIKPKLEYQRLTGIKKLIRDLSGNKWKLPEINW